MKIKDIKIILNRNTEESNPVIEYDKVITIGELIEAINNTPEDSDVYIPSFGLPNTKHYTIVDEVIAPYAMKSDSPMFLNFLAKSKENMRAIIHENCRVLAENEVKQFAFADLDQMVSFDQQLIIKQRLEKLKLSWDSWKVAEELLFRANSVLVSLDRIETMNKLGNAGIEDGVWRAFLNKKNDSLLWRPDYSYESFYEPEFFRPNGSGTHDIISLQPLEAGDLEHVGTSFKDSNTFSQAVVRCHEGSFANNFVDDLKPLSFFDELIARKVTMKCPEELKEDYLATLDRICDYVRTHQGIDQMQIPSKYWFGAPFHHLLCIDGLDDTIEEYYNNSKRYAETGITPLVEFKFKFIEMLPHLHLSIDEAIKWYILMETIGFDKDYNTKMLADNVNIYDTEMVDK